MSTITRPCPLCRRVQVGRLDVGPGGRGFVEEWPRCVCEVDATPLQLLPDELSDEERAAVARKTGVCMDCEAPVEGRRGWALRCADHKRRARLDAENAARRTPAFRKKQRKYDRQRRRGEKGKKRNARRRELHAERMATDPAYAAAYRAKRQRETSIKHPSYEKRLEYFRRDGARPERAQAKRDQAKARYYELHPERPAPPCCATCSEVIDWTPGLGRPPKYHQTRECNPWLARLRQGRAA